MDDLAHYNVQRWKALVEADAVFTRPALNLNPGLAQAAIDHAGQLGPVGGKDVLRLASGGGQKSVALALLHVNVTVVDFWTAYRPEILPLTAR